MVIVLMSKEEPLNIEFFPLYTKLCTDEIECALEIVRIVCRMMTM